MGLEMPQTLSGVSPARLILQATTVLPISVRDSSPRERADVVGRSPNAGAALRLHPDADLRTDPLKSRYVCDLHGIRRHPVDELENMPCAAGACS